LTWGFLVFPIALALLGLAVVELVFQEGLSLGALLPGLVFALGLLLTQAGLALLSVRRPLFPNALGGYGDPLLFPLVAVLTALGLVMVRRLAPDLLWAQTTWALMGLGIMLAVVFYLRQPARLRRYKYTWVLLGLVLMVLTLVVGVAPSGSGPRLWLTLGDFYFQPSELLKVLLAVFFAGYLAEKSELLTQAGIRLGPLRLPSPAYVGPLVVMWGLSMALLVWQRDLGAALLFLAVFLTMLYVATGRLAYVLGGLFLFLAGAGAAYLLFDHVRVRADIWLNPWARSQSEGYQIVQGLIALAAGGLFGTGLGRGYPGYIPFVHTDYVFAALGEELGLAGLIALLALYALLVGRGLRIALHAAQPFEVLLATGLTSILGLQTLTIVAGVLRLIPLTGITLPFISYGGSSLVISYLTVGLLLCLSAAGSDAPVRGRADLYQRVHRLAAFILPSFLALAMVLPYWQVWHASGLLARPDNPRRVEALRRTQRGRILDAQGAVLAYTEFDQVGRAMPTRRVYPYPPLATTVGYASFRHGSMGLERALDDALMGRLRPMTTWERFWDSVVGRPPAGEDVNVTLNLNLQRVADDALGEQAGVVLILDARDGRVLALASHPAYDPNRVDDDWELLGQDRRRPMLNRATEGLYPPGSLMQLVTLASALDAGLLAPTATLTTTDTFLAGEVTLHCPDHARHTDLATALADGCPVTFARLGLELGPARWSAGARRLGLGIRLPFELPTLAGQLTDSRESLNDPPTLARAAAGDGPTVTPLQVAQAALALAGPGVPHLTPGTPAPATPAISPETAVALRRLLVQATLRQGVLSGSDVAGLLVTAPTPAGGAPDAWFVGLTPAGNPRYVVVVLVEQAGPAKQIAAPVARRVLSVLSGGSVTAPPSVLSTPDHR